MRTTSPITLTLLVLANLVPLAGVVFFDWSLATLLKLYWAENAVIGGYTAVKMMMASSVGLIGKTKPYKLVLFGAHYATFWMFHGLLLREVFPDTSGDFTYLIAIPCFLIGHGASLKFTTWDRGERHRISAMAQMAVPYARVVPMHVVLLLVALMHGNDSGPITVAGVVMVKTVLDLMSHYVEHAIVVPKLSHVSQGT